MLCMFGLFLLLYDIFYSNAFVILLPFYLSLLFLIKSLFVKMGVKRFKRDLGKKGWRSFSLLLVIHKC